MPRAFSLCFVWSYVMEIRWTIVMDSAYLCSMNFGIQITVWSLCQYPCWHLDIWYRILSEGHDTRDKTPLAHVHIDCVVCPTSWLTNTDYYGGHRRRNPLIWKLLFPTTMRPVKPRAKCVEEPHDECHPHVGQCRWCSHQVYRCFADDVTLPRKALTLVINWF